jgi:hypothetical protein
MKIEQTRTQVKEKLGIDPLVDPKSWELFEEKLPEDLWPLLLERASAEGFVQHLPNRFPSDLIGSDLRAQECWEKVGNFHKNQGRFHDALSIYHALYNQLLDAQEKDKRWVNKATPLIWISDCYLRLGFSVLGKRYLILAHCEDSISRKGDVPTSGEGAVYFRWVWWYGLPDSDLRSYAKRIFEIYESNPIDALFPEWFVQNLDQNWMTEFPSLKEAGLYIANRKYIQYLMNRLGDKEGKNLELLAEYILSCMPGCRTIRRQRAKSTEYDIVCSIEGLNVDFRSEVGRYFVCECKDLENSVSITTMAKFCRVLDSTKSKFGILFATKGISGQGKTLYAEREQLKVYQDRGIIIVVIDLKDIKYTAEGGNFINLLRNKYEKMRLDLIEFQKKKER